MMRKTKLKISLLIVLMSILISSTAALAYECPVTKSYHYIITEHIGEQTCTTSAYVVYKCGPCGYVHSSKYYPALGHNWASATCEQPQRCTRSGCGATLGTAPGHLWGENSKGYYECWRCGATKPL